MTLVKTYPVGLVLLIAITANHLVVHFAEGHGRLLEPPSRASLFRSDEFAHLDPPKNYEDNELFCGGFARQYELNGGKCGICGNNYSDPVPRSYEDGGEHYRGIIVRGYRSGEQIPVDVELTASHLGYLEFRLCAKNDGESHLKQECYDEHLLKLAGKNTTKYVIPIRGEPYWAKYSLQIPEGVNCTHCVLQWHYRTGNRWGNCTDGSEGMGCGDQELFRACSDIVIYPQDTDESLVKRNPNSCRSCNIQKELPEIDDAANSTATSSTPLENSSISSWQFLHNLHLRNPRHGWL